MSVTYSVQLILREIVVAILGEGHEYYVPNCSFLQLPLS
jgi:hypothetical protein